MINSKAFTLLELILAIVIIGVLASVAIPKFRGLGDNAKISAELSTAASVQVALDACQGEWIINEGSFTCGASIPSSDLDAVSGYPAADQLGSSEDNPLNRLLKNNPTGWARNGNNFTGPASTSTANVTCKPNKPCKERHWEYNDVNGTFTLADN